MLGLVLLIALQNPAQPPAAALPQQQTAAETELRAKLAQVKRIYLEPFGDDAAAKQIQAAVVTSITESKLFIVTENKDKADATLKGTAEEFKHKESHRLNDAAAAISGRGGAAADDSTESTETIAEAKASVRLVSADGDVIWSTTQESKGAKYKGSTSDVADKVAKQLAKDVEKARNPPPQ